MSTSQHWSYTLLPLTRSTIQRLPVCTVGFECKHSGNRFPLGRKKLRELEESLSKVIALPHKALLVYYAAHLQQGSRDSPAKMFILAEQRPPTTLHDLLRITGPLSHAKATVCMVYFSCGSSSSYFRSCWFRSFPL